MLDARQQAIVIGTLLGDGCLEKNGIHFRLKVDHGITQREYVEWKFNQLADIATSIPKKIEFFDVRTSKTYIHWRFATKSTEEFDYFGRLFYNGRRRRVPPNIVELLISPLALAVWYMDDGYRRKDCRALHLNTQGYRDEEQDLLRKVLFRNFGIEVRIHRLNKYSKLYISSNQAENFCDLIRPYVISSMAYKLL